MPEFAALLVAMLVNGIAVEQFGVAWEVSVQENIRKETLARVYSYDALGSLLAVPSVRRLTTHTSEAAPDAAS